MPMSLSILDPEVATAIAGYISEGENYESYCEACEREKQSMAEWIYNYRLGKFNTYCQTNFGFQIEECNQ